MQTAKKLIIRMNFLHENCESLTSSQTVVFAFQEKRFAFGYEVVLELLNYVGEGSVPV